jgi:serine/threonine protein phosphatase 1
MPRTFAIGDIHGCLAALDALLDAIRPQPEDTLVTLGDYVDRGPDSRGVLERLIELQGRCRLVPLLGNHDEMMLLGHDGHVELYADWFQFGGEATLQSYGVSRPEEIPSSHADFLRGCPLWYESGEYFYLHGNYLADLPLNVQPREILLWDSLKRRLPGPHSSGKIGIIGHASQKTGEILDLGYAKCIDTWCYGDGWLTAIDAAGGRVWQADKTGRLRPLLTDKNPTAIKRE